jgi:Carboxypeptidase regulatory-like domain/TonB-dependent Receptor Plug Domain
MTDGSTRLVRVLLWVLVVFPALTGTTFGQGGTTATLSGIVVDASGAVVPGADVVAKQVATGVTTSAVSNAEGVFSFPALNIGTYSVTVTLQGFKTFVANDVVLTSGTGASVRAVLALGALEESINVTSSSAIVQTQSPTITTTITTNQITKLPLTSRSAMDFVVMIPGVATAQGNRNSVINGLPRGTINITLDGVNVQDNTLRSTDGFFAIVSPRLDAIEEVTVTTATQGADAGGQGAVQVKFVTRSGGNNFTGSGYYYYRNDKLNANTWFNNRNGVDKPKLLQNQEGFRVGGPIVKNKAFFFTNYEEFHQPSDLTRNRTVLNPQAQAGIFSYTASGVTRSVNLLQLAAANGLTGAGDPTITKVLGDIRSAMGTTGSLQTIDGNLDRYTFNVPTTSLRRYPTGRFDLNVTDKHRLSSAVSYQYFTDYPDTLNNFEYSFPGFPVAAGQASKRLGVSNWLRSTFTNNLINEARIGYSWAPVIFFGELNLDMYTGSTANTNGLHLTFPSVNSTLTSPGPTPTPQSRNATSLLFEDNVTWLKGAHSVTLGASLTQYSVWMKNSNLTPRIAFGIIATDPANAMFNAANFPGISAANLTAAQNLYALLTGRVSTITGDARLDESGQYAYMGTGLQQARQSESDLYVQDQWRLHPNLTLNVGLRYGLQFPFHPSNSNYTTASLADLCGVSGVNASGDGCNLFQPGAQPGIHPALAQFADGTRAYNVDYNNFAPTLGAVWTPSARPGWLGSVMGPEGEFVVRGGYTRAYSRAGLSDFTNIYNANPGVVIPVNRAATSGNLTLPGQSVLLFRDNQLGAASFNPQPTYPMIPAITASVNTFDPNINTPSADTWSVGVQRALGKDTSVEVRYVGTRARDAWANVNVNEIDIFENGFVNEFRNAQANLTANIASGRGATFAYTGAPGTAPLPILLAYLNGLPQSQAGNAAAYSGTNWTSATLQAFLAKFNPLPFNLLSNTANTGILNNATFRQNAVNAGLPANFFVANPDVLGTINNNTPQGTLPGTNYRTSIGSSRYNALQVEVRRRFAEGLQLQSSYVFGHQYVSSGSAALSTGLSFFTFRRSQFDIRNTGDPGDITHTFKLNAVYDLPFGAGHRIGGGSGGVLDRVVGGWQIGVTSIVRSGQLVDFGNVRLVGMTQGDLEKAFALRIDDAGRKVWMLPQDIIDNTIAAFSVSPTSANGYAGAAPTGRYLAPANGPDCLEVDSAARYGACAARSVVVAGPMFRQTDLRFSKRTRVAGKTDFEFAIEMLNAFNTPNFIPVGGVGTNTAIGQNINNYEVTQLTGTNTSRQIQLVTRFNW